MKNPAIAGALTNLQALKLTGEPHETCGEATAKTVGALNEINIMITLMGIAYVTRKETYDARMEEVQEFASVYANGEATEFDEEDEDVITPTKKDVVEDTISPPTKRNCTFAERTQ